ncbi:hypothetical protein [Methylotuvimicrobium buryatense]|nr:hypothetical protein [Methylotuvimicrobium buryatense]
MMNNPMIGAIGMGPISSSAKNDISKAYFKRMKKFMALFVSFVNAS